MSYSYPDSDFQTSTLSGAIVAGANSMTIGTGLNIPAANGVLQIDYGNLASIGLGVADGPETISYTAYNTGTGAVTGMTRGLARTTDVDHSNGATVQLGDSALYYTQLSTEMSAISTASSWMSAGETWTYASADDPTYTFTISGDLTTKYSAGMRLKLTNDGSVKYFIVTKVAYGAPNTTITCYGGTDYDLVNSAITDPYYSTDKAPISFPLDPTKWTVDASSTTKREQSPGTINVWYNAETLNVPIGVWKVDYSAYWNSTIATNGAANGGVTLSTANNSESDVDMTALASGISCATLGGIALSGSKILTLTTKAAYYLNWRWTVQSEAGAKSGIDGSLNKTLLRAVSAYL